MRVDLSLVNYLETSGISAGTGRLEGRSHLLSAGGSGANSERASWTGFSEHYHDSLHTLLVLRPRVRVQSTKRHKLISN